MADNDDEVLLQQADALIRRHQATQPDIYAQLIPTLTDVVEPELPPGPAAVADVGSVPENPSGSAILAAPGLSDAQLQAISSDIYHRILQNLDIHTDEAIRRYLAPQLEGVLNRALSGLLDELNHSIGGMVRNYVAESLDLELQNLRQSYKAESATTSPDSLLPPHIE